MTERGQCADPDAWDADRLRDEVVFCVFEAPWSGQTARPVVDSADEGVGAASGALRRALEIDLAWQLHTRRSPDLTNIRATLSERQNHRCCWCGVRTTEAGPHAASTEHIVPRAKGGSDDENNLAMACRDCNTQRGSDMVGWLPSEWCFITPGLSPIANVTRRIAPSNREINEWNTYRSSRTTAAEYLADLWIRVDRWNDKHHSGLTWWEIHRHEFEGVRV